MIRDFLREERSVLVIFLVSRLLLWAVAWLAQGLFKPGDFTDRAVPGQQFWNLLLRWDAGWYLGIVDGGYAYDPAKESNVAFFPLLPLLIKAFMWTGLNAKVVGFFVSNTCLLGSAILFRRFAARQWPVPSPVPLRAVTLLLFCPVSFFHSAIYTESLFLFLTLAAFVAVQNDRWLLAGLAGAFLTATRANGILILPALLVEAVLHARAPRGDAVPVRWRRYGWLLLVPLGLAAYMAFLQVQFGDALVFGKAQAAWNRHLASPWDSIRDATRLYPPAYARLFVGAAILGTAGWFFGWVARIRPGALVFAGCLLFSSMSTTLLESFPRYVSILFPLYLATAVATRKSETAYSLALVASALLLALCTALFAAGYWMT